ncbi:MAG: GAF domain-containing protein [Myxococcota bacterium]
MDNSDIAVAAKALLRSSFDTNAISGFLAAVGKSVAVHRAYVFEFERPGRSTVLAHQRYEWNSGASEPQIDNPELQNLNMTETLGNWLEAFDQGHPYYGVVRTFSPAERELLESQEIRSILVCPIHLEDNVWGFAGFDDCVNERQWAFEERSVLQHASTALACGLRQRSLRARLDAARGALGRIIDDTSLT